MGSSQTKDFKIGICCFSTKDAVLKEYKAKTGFLGIRMEQHVYAQAVVSVS